MFSPNSTILRSVASEDNQLVSGAVGLAAILATTVVYLALRSGGKEHGFPKLRGVQLYHAWDFFQQRYDFLMSNLERNSGKSFSFNVLRNNVIVLAGEDARRVFYPHPHLDLGEGIKILLGTTPRIQNVDNIEVPAEGAPGEATKLFNKKLNKLFSHSRIQSVLPTLLQDIIDETNKWGNGGKNGRIHAFTEVYDLVFVMTARMTTCEDLTKNEADLKRILELFSVILTSASPLSLILRWLPSPSKKAIRSANTEMFNLLSTYVEARRNAEPTSEAIDVLIAEGETTQSIVDYIMKVLFAGVVNTGIVSCWALVYLAAHPEWREKCKKEIQDMLSRHLDDSLPVPLHEKLADIPISAWQDEIPILDACIQETHRLSLSPVSLRRNLGKDIKIGEQVVKRGDFLVYPINELHFNPEYYPEPHMYDPGRWLQPNPVLNTAYQFLGWGAGRHPCTGMKIAKLEMKMILAVFLTKYEYKLVDGDGGFPDPLPVPDRNNFHKVCPIGPTCYFEFNQVSMDGDVSTTERV